MEIEKLYQQALEFLDIGEIKRARKLGKILVGERFTGGFEILARCFLEEEKIKEAIKILNEGIQKAPDSWPLWRQLGNLYSDQENYALARKQYDRAQECPGVDTDLLNYDRALTYCREENFAEGLRLLDELPQEWHDESAGLKASALRALKMFEVAIKHCRIFIARLEEKGIEEGDSYNLSTLYSELASVLWETERSSEALHLTVKAIRIHPHSFALSTLREIQNLNSDKAKFFNLMVHGKWDSHIDLDEDGRIPEFFRSYQIVAESPEEAFEFTKIFESEDTAKTMSIEEFKIEEIDSPLLKGVYEVSPHMLYIDE